MQITLSFPSNGDNPLLVNKAKDWPSLRSLYETTHSYLSTNSKALGLCAELSDITPLKAAGSVRVKTTSLHLKYYLQFKNAQEKTIKSHRQLVT